MLVSNTISIINNVHVITTDHQTNDKARVAAAAAAPQTRISNVAIAPDVDWPVGLAEVDEDTTGVAVVPADVMIGAPALVLLSMTEAVLEFAAIDDDNDIEELLAKDGGGTESEGLTRAPVPQGIGEPSG